MDESKRDSLSPTYPAIISFGITFVRVVLACICIPLLQLKGYEVIVACIIAAIMMLDYYDGKLFKRSSLNQMPLWRKVRRIMDSCGDRICIQLVCVSVLLLNKKFIFPYLVICLKEIFTSSICLTEFSRGLIIYPPKTSKISTIFVGLTTISAVLNNVYCIMINLAMLALTGIVSCLSYCAIIKKLNAGTLAEGIDFEVV